MDENWGYPYDETETPKFVPYQVWEASFCCAVSPGNWRIFWHKIEGVPWTPEILKKFAKIPFHDEFLQKHLGHRRGCFPLNYKLSYANLQCSVVLG